jgi:hypothetical protein
VILLDADIPTWAMLLAVVPGVISGLIAAGIAAGYAVGGAAIAGSTAYLAKTAIEQNWPWEDPEAWMLGHTKAMAGGVGGVLDAAQNSTLMEQIKGLEAGGTGQSGGTAGELPNATGRAAGFVSDFTSGRAGLQGADVTSYGPQGMNDVSRSDLMKQAAGDAWKNTGIAVGGAALSALGGGALGALGGAATSGAAAGTGSAIQAAGGGAAPAAASVGGTLLEGVGGPLTGAASGIGSGVSSLPAIAGGTLLPEVAAGTGRSITDVLGQVGLRTGMNAGYGAGRSALEGEDPLGGAAMGAAGTLGGAIGGELGGAVPYVSDFTQPLGQRFGSSFASAAASVPFQPGMPPPPPVPMGIDPYTGMPIPGPYAGQQPWWMRY